MAANPYTPPRAQVADVDAASDEVQEVKLWSASGRIGRLRYLAYSVGSSLIAFVAAIALVVLLGPALGGVAMVLLYIPLFVFGVLTAIQRSHDMDWSGWMIFLMMIPLAAFIWIFKAGTPGSNRFGAPPPPNTTGVKILGYSFPVLIVLSGILAAVAIPAYQDYVRRAQEAQQQQGQ